MKAKAKKISRKKTPVAGFQPGIVSFLIALVAALSMLLLAYLGVTLSM